MSKGTLEAVKTKIESFLEVYLAGATTEVRAPKAIHDSLWGTHLFQPHEIALLNTPLLQRLRQIHQTSLAYFTFPSATHTRFEHTIGVVNQCDKLFEALRKKYSGGALFNEEDLLNVRLSALLHDCGHSAFSHASEEVYRFCDDMQYLCGSAGPYKGKNAHEILASLIVSSEQFEKFLLQLEKKYNFKCDRNLIAEIIVGKSPSRENKYLTQIINGPFDADKLDYIYRDGHFSGLPLKVDLDRLWYAVEQTFKDDDRILIVNFGGASPLEQILFCKIVLFSTIYHHHKVRAADCMLKSIVEYVRNKNIEISINDTKLTLNEATDFLWLTDDAVFAQAYLIKDRELHRLIHNLLYRRLFKRALTICKDTIKDSDKSLGYQDLQKLTQRLPESHRQLRELARQIWETAAKPCLPEEIWVDLPHFPPTHEADETFVSYPSGKSGENQGDPELRRLTSVFPAAQWVDLYVKNKWKGHVFCPPDCQAAVSVAARSVIEAEYGLQFNEWTNLLCHIE